MGLGSYSQDWDEVDKKAAEGASSGDSGVMSKNERLYKFRFSIPKPNGTDKQKNLVMGRPAKKRIVFLPFDDPSQNVFTIYEHGIFKNPYAEKILGYNTVCISRSSADWRGGPCPICSNKEMKSYARFMGFFPIIDMGQVERKGADVDDIVLHHASWKDKDGNVHWRKFEQVLLPAPKGSSDKPGLLSTLKWKASEVGVYNLVGTVWDATRTGDKMALTGDDWQFVKQLPDGGIMDYIVKYGAVQEEVDIVPPIFIQRDPDKMKSEPGIFDFDLDALYKRQQMAAMSPVAGNNNANVSGAGYGNYQGAPPPGDDDDIPF